MGDWEGREEGEEGKEGAGKKNKNTPPSNSCLRPCGEITQNNGLWSVQGHSMSPISVPIEMDLICYL